MVNELAVTRSDGAIKKLGEFLIRVLLRAGPAGESANLISGRIEGLLFNGANSRLLVATGDGGNRITAALPQSGPFVDLSEGENVAMAWPAQSTLCFPAAAP